MAEVIHAYHVPLGKMKYDKALDIQKRRAKALSLGIDDLQTVYTVEHSPTITVGRNGSDENIVASEEYLRDHGFSVYHVDRGGDVTYHGPGQLVVYPVLHLSPWGNDVGQYVRNLEQVVIDALADVGIDAGRDEAHPGVWVNDEKICAVGCHVQRRRPREFVTSHGIALNISTDLSHFDTIIPCGIKEKGVTSVARLMSKSSVPASSFEDWTTRVLGHFEAVFGLRFETMSEGDMDKWEKDRAVLLS